jgi:hypothetical protein
VAASGSQCVQAVLAEQPALYVGGSCSVLSAADMKPACIHKYSLLLMYSCGHRQLFRQHDKCTVDKVIRRSMYGEVRCRRF